MFNSKTHVITIEERINFVRDWCDIPRNATADDRRRRIREELASCFGGSVAREYDRYVAEARRESGVDKPRYRIATQKVDDQIVVLAFPAAA